MRRNGLENLEGIIAILMMPLIILAVIFIVSFLVLLIGGIVSLFI